MRGAALLLAVAPCLSTAVQAAEPAPSIGKVSLGQTRSQVEASMGRPLRVINTGDALGPELRFDGLTVWFWEGAGVAQIRSTSSAHCLVGGLCPGASQRELDRRLGRPSAKSGNLLHYAVKAEACWLEVALVGGVASSLEIKCQP